MSRRLAEVALPLPLRQTFTYTVPDELEADLVIGASVVVPFGRRTLTGYVVGRPDEPPDGSPGRLKSLSDILDPGPLFPGDLLDLTRWMAEYYLSGWGEVLRAAVPEGAQVRSKIRAALREDSEDPGDLPMSESKLLDALRKAGEADAVALGRSARVRSPHHALRRLAEKGLVTLTEEVRRSGYARTSDDLPPLDELGEEEELLEYEPTADQRKAIAPLQEAIRERRFQVALLHGVTGSGKTAVYEALTASTLEQGRGAIVLVPEISITPQMVRLFRARFGDQVALFHSRLKARDRHHQWQRVLRGEARVVIGPRSAVLAPVPDLGLIVVDEEHEPSYKQSEPAPRYHARDVAVYRARLTDAVCVLGSATPCAESYQNAREGKYLLLEMPERVRARPMPAVRLIDLGSEPKPWERTEAEQEAGKGEEGAGVIFSEALLEALALRLDRSEQSILFLNRRGFSPVLTCQACGHTEECDNCSVSLTYHSAKNHLRCHYCGVVRKPPTKCPACGADPLRFQGLGTQRVEEALHRRFPGARVLRMDSDTTRKRGAHADIYRAFAAGEGEILLGTQMVAKGFHFPAVTLVGVISADAELHFPDFRANERTYQLLTQVAGRAGRGEVAGEVIVQTWSPDNPGVRCAAEGLFEPFMAHELETRRALGYPPFGRMARVLVRGRKEDEVLAAVEKAAGRLRKVAPGSVQVLGPAPAPLYRVNRWYRAHVLLKGEAASTLRRCVEAARLDGLERNGIGVTVDVDPVDVL